jgi:hypothetical protein
VSQPRCPHSYFTRTNVYLTSEFLLAHVLRNIRRSSVDTQEIGQKKSTHSGRWWRQKMWRTCHKTVQELHGMEPQGERTARNRFCKAWSGWLNSIPLWRWQTIAHHVMKECATTESGLSISFQTWLKNNWGIIVLLHNHVINSQGQLMRHDKPHHKVSGGKEPRYLLILLLLLSPSAIFIADFAER